MKLGAGFYLPEPVEFVDDVVVEQVDVEALRTEQILVALGALREALVEMPTPQVHVAAPDLAEIVTAVNGLKPGATADDIARAVVEQITPGGQPELDGVLSKLVQALERLDFRLKGIGTGSGGGALTSSVRNEMGTALDTRQVLLDTRYEWQQSAGSSVPLYIGSAPPGTPTSTAAWRIEKYTYTTGPAGDAVPAVVQSVTGAWDSRTSLF